MADLPLKQGLFHIPESQDDRPYLFGSRCRVCGYTCFPRKVICVRCRLDTTMEGIKVGPYGTLESFAIMRVGLPDFPPPYIMGYVRMKEGVVIFGLMTGCEVRDDALEIGEEMEMVIEKIKEDEKGNNLIGWKFKPIKRKTS